jgi:hypothetical protein
MHKFEVMVTRKAEGKTGQAFIGAMTEEKSVELASKLASESFLFVVGLARLLRCMDAAHFCSLRSLHTWPAHPLQSTEAKISCVCPVSVLSWLAVRCGAAEVHAWVVLQVASLILFIEYDRTRRKEIKKQHKDAAERQAILDRARQEREVSSMASGSCGA